MTDYVGSWAAVPTAVPPSAVVTLADCTLRHVAHLSIGGDALRVRVTNEFGREALQLGEVRVARRHGAAAGTRAEPGTDRAVTFAGEKSVAVPAGQALVSDPVDLTVTAGADLLISLYLPHPTAVTTLAAAAYQHNRIAAGNVAASTDVEAATVIEQVFFVSGVSVRAAGTAIVTLGDSITNGAGSTANANRRWPDLFAARLRAAGTVRGVCNVGVDGNRLLHDPNPPSAAEAYAVCFGPAGLRRFDRDVLGQPGATDLIVLLGTNDLGHPGGEAPLSETVTVGELIAGHRELIRRARAAGLKAYAGTILPFLGCPGFFTAENERKRQEWNGWLRDGREYDGVVDFDAVTRDPHEPRRLLPAYDSGDHLHPSDAGMAALAGAVPLEWFR